MKPRPRETSPPLRDRPTRGRPSVRVVPEETNTAPGPPDGRDVVQDLVARVWAEVLELDEVPAEASLFELGGHSLTATRIHARLARTFPLPLTVPDVLEAGSVAGLTDLILSLGDQHDVDPVHVCGLLHEVEGLSDTEVGDRLSRLRSRRKAS